MPSSLPPTWAPELLARAYYSDDSVVLIHGDCLDVLASLDDKTVDTVLTDPLTALESADLRQHPIVVWDKATLGMGAFFRNQHEFIVHLSAGTPTEALRRDIPNVIRVPKVRDGEHPTEKPDELLRILLSVVSPAGGVVLDPFAGSGSTLFAAKGSGRRAIGVEADERYAEIAARRLSQDALDFEGAS